MVPMQARKRKESPHEARSSGRESAPSSQLGSQSRLTSAATVQEFNALTFSVNSRPDPLPQGEGERFRALRPVEYKKGKRRQFENTRSFVATICSPYFVHSIVPRNFSVRAGWEGVNYCPNFGGPSEFQDQTGRQCL